MSSMVFSVKFWDEIFSSFGRTNLILSLKSNTLGVAFYYLNVLAAASEDKWPGKSVIINQILDTFWIRGK